MNRAQVDAVARAVLYEGHILYPYRPSAIKNRRRFTFGRVYPPRFSDWHEGRERSSMLTECLVQSSSPDRSTVAVTVRFLHVTDRKVFRLGPAGTRPQPVTELYIGGRSHYTWQDVEEREVRLAPSPLRARTPVREAFRFPGWSREEELRENGYLRGLVRVRQEAISGDVVLTSREVDENLFAISVRVRNRADLADDLLTNEEEVVLRTLVSTHTLLGVEHGRFVSLVEPPDEMVPYVQACTNAGTWPVLVGDRDRADMMLSSPIILYDYPQIAPESHGDLFDGTEIDELLSLRILTLTDGEKQQMQSADPIARRILERTEGLGEADFSRMHGMMRRDPFSDGEARGPDHVRVRGVNLRVGDCVRIRPVHRADVMDLALKGKTATIEAIEEDFEGRLHFALVLDEDPGRDLGLLRQPGHRFFFGPDEVEPVEQAFAGGDGPVAHDGHGTEVTGDGHGTEVTGEGHGTERLDALRDGSMASGDRPTVGRVLVAGIGNVLRGDDAFGVVVSQELAARDLPAGVRVADFGTRAYDLAFAMVDGFETVVWVDTVSRGHEPGTVVLLDPMLDTTQRPAVLDGHSMHPLAVLDLVNVLGGFKGKLLVVGCEPETLESTDGRIGLTDRVLQAVPVAIEMIERVIDECRRSGPEVRAT